MSLFTESKSRCEQTCEGKQELIYKYHRKWYFLVILVRAHASKIDIAQASIISSGVILRSKSSSEKTGEHRYGVATISRLLNIIGLFCKRAL